MKTELKLHTESSRNHSGELCAGLKFVTPLPPPQDSLSITIRVFVPEAKYDTGILQTVQNIVASKKVDIFSHSDQCSWGFRNSIGIQMIPVVRNVSMMISNDYEQLLTLHSCEFPR